MSNRIFAALALGCALTAIGCSDGTLATIAPLATGQRGVTALVADGDFVYWSLTDGSVNRVSVDGGKVQTVVSGLTMPAQLVVDDSRVYWSTLDGGIGSAPKAGGDTTSLAEGEDGTVGLQLDDKNVFWARSSGEVKKAEKGGGALTLLATDPTRPSSLAQSDGTLCWTSGGDADGALHTVDVDRTGGTYDAPPIVRQLISPRSLAATPGVAFWASLDPDALAADPTSSAEVLTRVNLDGSDVRTLSTGLASVDAMIADDATLYLSTLDGNVLSLPVDGGDAVSFATGPKGRTSIAVDTTSVYWAHAGGDAIFALPKN